MQGVLKKLSHTIEEKKNLYINNISCDINQMFKYFVELG